jgi:hypothetical protein
MEKHSLHPALEVRVAALAARVAELKRKMSRPADLGHSLGSAEIAELEARRQMLEDKVRDLKQAGPSFQQDVKSEIEAVADDMTGWIEDHLRWIDSGYRPDRRPVRRDARN